MSLCCSSPKTEILELRGLERTTHLELLIQLYLALIQIYTVMWWKLEGTKSSTNTNSDIEHAQKRFSDQL